jgi:hypothetical protein
MLRSRFSYAILLFIPGLSFAGNDLDGIENLDQSTFKVFAENMVAATAYKATAPAEPLGITGFDIGIGLTAVDLDKEVFELASEGGWDYSYLPVPRLFAQKGLPFDIDVGASYTDVPGVFTLFGAELKYAMLSGSVATPAVAVRISYSKLSGIDELDVENKGIDLSISKGFTVLTPYAGIGRTFSTVTPVDVPILKEEDIEDSVIYAGVNINLGVNLGFEVNKTAGVTSYSGKVGIRF